MTEQSKSAYVLVPREPTREMKAAGGFHCIRGAGPTEAADMQQAEAVFTAMIAASPPAPMDDERLREIRERARFVPLVKDYGWEHVEDAAGDVSYLLDTIASLQARVGELEGTYQSAVNGRREFRQALRDERKRAAAAEEERDRRGELLERLIQAATLLYQNAEGCAITHYGEDFANHGLPGWLSDAQADIEAARAALKDTTP